MTFARIQALCGLVNRYKSYLLSFECPFPHDAVVVFISFDLLNELRARCVKSFIATDNGKEYFKGCQVFIDLTPDFLGVAYKNRIDGKYHDISEITDEDMK